MSFNPIDLMEKIYQYRKMNLREVPLDAVYEHFKEMLSICYKRRARFGGEIYRVRSSGSAQPYTLRKDVWAPPPECITVMQRANDVQDSIFYASLHKDMAVREAKIEKGMYFSFLTCICSEKETSCSLILDSNEITNEKKAVSDNGYLYLMILKDFMFTEFSRPVGTGTEFQYKASCAIAQHLLRSPDIDSMIYPSVFDNSKYNVAMKVKAANRRLTFKEVLFCRLIDCSNGQPVRFSVESRGVLAPDGETINYDKNHTVCECEFSD